MFFDIGAGEILGLAILAMFLVGPERLPKLASEAAKIVKKIRVISQNATVELRKNLGPGFENLQPADLNPKTFLKKQLTDAIDESDKPVRKKIIAKIDPDLL